MQKVMERKDIQEETESVEIPFSTKQTEHIILDTHVDNKNDNIKENLYQRKEVAINIIYMTTENQEIMHNPLQMDQMLLDIEGRLGNMKTIQINLYGLPGNTAKVLLLRQVRHLKAKAVYISVNANFNPKRSAFWAESKNNPIQQKGAKTSPRYRSEIKEKKTTRFIKKDENRTGRKTLELGNYTTMKSKLEKIESSYSSSRAIATSDTGRVHEKTQGIQKKEGLEGANLKGKEKEHLRNDVGNMIKDRFMRINKAEGSRKMKTSEDYQVLKLDYIWISKEWTVYIIQASTKDMDLVMNSNYKLLITALDTGINTRFRSYAEMRKKGKRRLVFELEKAMEDNWKKLAKMLKTEDTGKTDILQLLRKCIKKLGTFCHRIRKRVLMLQEEKELHKLCKDIEKNYEIDTSCEHTQDIEEKKRDLENI
ncbi:9707_t:CDS:2 [Gigaspora margarita]|uniref:9707_t:CDS:1 n=1 Tax=Gigaspora margarita TaxID=4874 RepID=A0ABN7W3G2_GIGMA|nr:9707_t:CDS:2 [Gigaspora margarita]